MNKALEIIELFDVVEDTRNHNIIYPLRENLLLSFIAILAGTTDYF